MLTKRIFQFMLLAYPRDFRLEYESEMTQLFRDCYRDIHSGGFPSVLFGYIVSFILWLTIPWIWSQTKTSTEALA